ncbi:hypothetical protein C5E06_18435 [Pseudoclavibacter sp. RFBI5]|uniref:hypothetical protein n=1 Tax=Pseudoclavibacter sp. RFBI5 TaxID=2080578 RepID=UPI000CE808FE|nr:hypothetical protein [Pseudoclavibacter sp. RFBI5]PPG00674.1 hypothetical protein C5E06_18435 [Pseudoclavibacter sp. RFBI5]
MSIAATAPGGAAQRGTTRLTAKALNRLVSAVAGDALGVDAGSVSVDHNGKLALRLSTPIRVPSLGRIREQPSSISRSGGPLLERVETAKTTIRDRVQSLSGSSISAVTIRLTGLEIKPEERVR